MADKTIAARMTAGRMGVRLAAATAVLLVADLVFWLTADFGSFVPASDGVLYERLFFAGVTASGPLAMVINGHFVNLAQSLAVSLGIVAALVATSLVGRRLAIARMAGYAGVVLWFFFGLAVAGMRMT